MKEVVSALGRPSTMDLGTPPATPQHVEVQEPKADPPQQEEQPPGETEANKEKEKKQERQRKRHAQWARFIRSLESAGPCFYICMFIIFLQLAGF